MSKIAHTEPGHAANGGSSKLTKVASHPTDKGADAARESMQAAQRTVGAVSGLQHETVRRSAEGAPELGQLFVQLFNEQTRHNLQVATAFGRAVNWGEVAQAQSDFVRGSFERMNQLTGRHRELIQARMKAMAFTART